MHTFDPPFPATGLLPGLARRTLHWRLRSKSEGKCIRSTLLGKPSRANALIKTALFAFGSSWQKIAPLLNS